MDETANNPLSDAARVSRGDLLKLAGAAAAMRLGKLHVSKLTVAPGSRAAPAR